ncbi:ABC transporter ATP-binding protein [Leucobacter sp. UCMA 4100]|nr:ABC transporter ATP-binding protein [Leucobacter sp. UCMA 4100]
MVTMTAKTGLEVMGATVTFDAETVVRDLSLSLAEGEVVAILGPSGCGKSTLLRAIAGLEPLAEGTVLWGGEDLARIAPHRRGFGLMFQDGQLFSHLSVAENVAYGLRVKGMGRDDRAARVAEMLGLVGLADAAERPVTELSGGQQQRVALARSLAPSPKLLMLDEPLSALDRELREQLAGDLATLLRQTRTTAILVTHDEAEATRIADRVLRMAGGELVA